MNTDWIFWGLLFSCLLMAPNPAPVWSSTNSIEQYGAQVNISSSGPNLVINMAIFSIEIVVEAVELNVSSPYYVEAIRIVKSEYHYQNSWAFGGGMSDENVTMLQGENWSRNYTGSVIAGGAPPGTEGTIEFSWGISWEVIHSNGTIHIVDFDSETTIADFRVPSLPTFPINFQLLIMVCVAILIVTVISLLVVTHFRKKRY